MKNRFKILFIKACDGPQVIEMPLGIMYLSACLKIRLEDSIAVDLIDLRLERKWGRVLLNKINSFQPDLIGISLLSGDRSFLDEWLVFLKHHSRRALIVIGGPLATYDGEEILRAHPEVDFAVIGEGEMSFVNLVQMLMNEKKPGALAGVAFLNGETLVYPGRQNPVEDLDAIPFPDYSLIDLSRYTNRGHIMNGLQAEKVHAIIISSRGCPYGCLYCHDIFGKKFRPRSSENFMAEIIWLYHHYGVREFHIVDDIFNLHKDRLHDILNRIIHSGLKIKIAFPNGIRADLLDETDIMLLKQAGCYMMTFAIETASRRLQRIIRKNLDLDKAMENIHIVSRAGIITRSFFMLGFPGETVEEIQATISLARRSPLDLVFFFTVVPFKNTGLARLAADHYPHLNCREDHYLGASPFYQQATGYPLKRVQTMAYIKFYLPFRLFRTFFKLPHKGRVLAGWIDMTVFTIFTRPYEYLKKIQNRPPSSSRTKEATHS